MFQTSIKGHIRFSHSDTDYRPHNLFLQYCIIMFPAQWRVSTAVLMPQAPADSLACVPSTVPIL